jgi:aspartate aminotransferase
VKLSERTDHLKPEGAYQVLGRALALEAQGREIIHLEVGEPDFEAPLHVRQAGADALLEGRARYNPPAGLAGLREAIAQDAGRRRGITVRPECVLISPGAKPNLFFPTLALVSPGDEVIYPDPGFPTYPAMIGVAGGIPVPVPLREERGFSLDLECLERLITSRTRVLILNSPSNPTGGVIPLQDLQAIAALAQKHGLWILSDEIYTRLAFDGRDVLSIASLAGMLDRTVIVDGFSKTYAMTGWRLGFGIMPEPLAQRVELLFTHAHGCTAEFTQIAALEALRGPQDAVERMVATYQVRRDLVVDGLNRLPGIHCLRPQGAFYAFPNIRGSGMSSEVFAERLLEGGVALLPGTAFGVNGEGYLRLSFANSSENLRRALERIEAVLESLDASPASGSR